MSSDIPAVSEANGDDGLRRRNSLERYRPGAYFNEEREKLRRRAHFGESRLSSGSENNRRPHQGQRRGNRGRGGGRGGGRGDFHSYRDGTKTDDRDGQDEDEVQSVEVEAPPPPIGNWADEVSDTSPEQSPKKTDPKVNDLRDKLNAMRMGKDQRHKRNSGNGENNRNHGNRGRGGGRNNGPNHHGGHNHYHQRLPMPKRNTVNFDPSHKPLDMRIIPAEAGLKKYNRIYQTRDVVMVQDLFCAPDDLTIYNKLLDEIQNCGVDAQRLWQLWHGDSHVIADDSRAWKEKCPTFSWVVEKMAGYFDMDVKATRLNWYRDSSEWKPFHHDAAAMKEKFAKTQNFTLAVSFGAERDAAFEHAQTKATIALPQPNGAVYTFGRDVNILWRHGIPQLPPEKQSDEGRISIIAWGWIDMEEV